MAQKISRRKLAQHAASQIAKGDDSTIDELAALLVAEGRQKEVDILVRNIENELLNHNILVARVEAAKPLTDELRKSVTNYLTSEYAGVKAENVRIKETVNPDLIGGIRIKTPTGQLDDTIAKKLNDLRSKKI